MVNRRSSAQGKREEDSLTREMFVITALGLVPAKIRGSRKASLLGQHAAAVQHFLRSGDDARLSAFEGKRVAGYELIVDTELLSELARAGALRLDDLYASPKRA